MLLWLILIQISGYSALKTLPAPVEVPWPCSWLNTTFLPATTLQICQETCENSTWCSGLEYFNTACSLLTDEFACVWSSRGPESCTRLTWAACDSCYRAYNRTAEDGQPCVFPFYFQDTAYTGCTTDQGVDQPWCATSPVYTDNPTWGICDGAWCPGPDVWSPWGTWSTCTSCNMQKRRDRVREVSGVRETESSECCEGTTTTSSVRPGWSTIPLQTPASSTAATTPSTPSTTTSTTTPSPISSSTTSAITSPTTTTFSTAPTTTTISQASTATSSDATPSTTSSTTNPSTTSSTTNPSTTSSATTPSTTPSTSGWTPWSAWTPCSTSCGPGVTRRIRECEIDLCPGDSGIIAICDVTCEGAAWSEWTACTCNATSPSRSRVCPACSTTQQTSCSCTEAAAASAGGADVDLPALAAGLLAGVGLILIIGLVVAGVGLSRRSRRKRQQQQQRRESDYDSLNKSRDLSSGTVASSITSDKKFAQDP